MTDRLFALGAPLVASLTQRHGSRGVMTVGGLVLAGALLAVSLVDGLWQLYALSFVVGASSCALSFIAVGTGITQRFRRHRGLAIGLATSGSAVGGLIMSMLLTQVLVNFGWRPVLLVAGLVAGLVSYCFGARAHAQIFGLVSMIGLLGYAFGSGLAGVAFDHPGSYNLFFTVYAGVYCVEVGLFFFVRTPRLRAAVVTSAT